MNDCPKEMIENFRRKEETTMQNNYEAPELTLIGEANEVVMGALGDGVDFPHEFSMDFEFEQD
jgi:hypothetical protein